MNIREAYRPVVGEIERAADEIALSHASAAGEIEFAHCKKCRGFGLLVHLPVIGEFGILCPTCNRVVGLWVKGMEP